MFETFDRAVSTTRKHEAILFCPPQGAIGMLEEAKKKLGTYPGYYRASSMPEKIQRRRSARRKFSLFVISSLIAVVLLIVGTSLLLFRPIVLRFAVVETKTEDVAFVRGIERLFSRERFAIRTSPIFVKDEAARAAILESGKADLAVVRASPDLSQKFEPLQSFGKMR